MEKADLYSIENDLNSIYSKETNDKKISINDELIMNSILYHYTQSYLFGKTFASSALFEDNKGHTHVGLISYNEIENEMAKVDANAFLAANFDYIGTDAKKMPEGFAIYAYRKYTNSFGRLSGTNDIDDPKKPILLPLAPLLKDYPLCKIPSSSFIEFGDVKYDIDKFYGSKIYSFPDLDKRTKIQALSIEEIMEAPIGKKVMLELFKNPLYEKIFEQSPIAKKINLLDKKEYQISLINFTDPYTQLNELSKLGVDENTSEYQKIFNYLKKTGLNYVSNIKDQKALVAHNEYGIAGMLIFGNNFSDQEEKTKNKVLWLSSIATSREHRGNGVAVDLFNHAVKYSQDNELILFRTTPSANGSEYLEKSIDKIIKENNLNNIIHSNDIDRELGIKLVKIIYGEIEKVEKNGKEFSLKKTNEPYKEFNSIIGLFRESCPSMDNIKDSIDFYDRLDQKTKISESIYNMLVENLLDKNIVKNKNKNKP